MEKTNLRNIERVVATIAIIVLVVLMFRNDSARMEQLNELEGRVEMLEFGVTEIGSDLGWYVNDIHSRLHQTKNDLYEIWFASLNDESLQRLDEWEDDNPNFVTCFKDYKDFKITRSALEGEMGYGWYFVAETRKGHLIYDRDGNVNCYLRDTETGEFNETECVKLCIDYEEEEDDSFLEG